MVRFAAAMTFRCWNRDLLDLVERELLVKAGQGRATHFRLKSPCRLKPCRSRRLRIACGHLNARCWMFRDCRDCVRQVDNDSKGSSIISLFGVAPLEAAPLAQHPPLLVVGKRYSVTRPP